MELRALQARLANWTNHNFPNAKRWEPLLGMGEELGELDHAFLKAHQGIRGTQDEHYREMQDAIGDIVVYMCHFCSLNNLNLAECVSFALDEVLERDWIKYPKDGVSE